jgi:CubicO group peptidase (beta-lactamase class C family)
VRKEAGVSLVPGTVGEYNWGGAGGTYFWVDPKEDLFVLYMMQSPKQRVPYRALLKDMIYGAVEKAAR